jgi:hypothetical protein
MNLTELKAAAYDALANIEFWQRKLQEINQEIAEKSKSVEAKEPKQEEEK